MSYAIMIIDDEQMILDILPIRRVFFMHRLLFFSLALVCLLAGCSAPQASDPAPDASNDLAAYFEEEPAANEMGAA